MEIAWQFAKKKNLRKTSVSEENDKLKAIA